MAVTGRTGADAIFKFLHSICRVLGRYELKLRAAVDAAQTAGAITSAQKTTIITFIDLSSAACVAFEALSNFTGFTV